MSNTLTCGVMIGCIAAVEWLGPDPRAAIPMVTLFGMMIGALLYRIARSNGQKTRA